MRNLALTTPTIPAYTCHAFAKSKASRGKLNKLQLANSTPLNRAFFVRIFRTPKENALGVFLSMVERNRKGLALCRFPIVAVFHPVTFYRQTVESLAVAFNNLQLELSIMLYKFLLLGEKRLKIAILANSEQEARQRLQLSTNAVCFARIKGGELC
ncbi:ash family protein [Avibacterium paragallinarum]|uniref:ash family protein n=1 Tax=Avibacterium paragallinarum TaxID=728 RepID=UPI0021F77774|nr:ash family protein [Avibacterium paragallinarum]UXN34895.1 ash family protein [Avibacterium paragallinarum]